MMYVALVHLLYVYKNDPLKIIETYSLHMQIVHVICILIVRF
jgi:hypothetical protein